MRQSSGRSRTDGLHEKVKYESNLAAHSFREETFFSLRSLISGFKIGVDTGAIIYHLVTHSGGERSYSTAGEDMKQNEKLLKKFVRENKKELKVLTDDESVFCVEKNTNLVIK